MDSSSVNKVLRNLPQIEEILQDERLKALKPYLSQHILTDCARGAVREMRRTILNETCIAVDKDSLAEATYKKACAYLSPSLRRVINATGVVIHTNLGRSALAKEAVDAVVDVARGYSTLEYDTASLSRGSRHTHIERLICALTGAEAALAVNNNAAATMMVLSEFASDKEVIVSRGELVEIGGSFRIPDIMAFSHAHMKEVGTTNKTHQSDYENSLTPHTALLLKVHPSNYRITGFTESVGIAALRRVADNENKRRRKAAEYIQNENKTEVSNKVLIYEDQGSGAFVHLDCFGAYAEPTVKESLKAGADLVSFSGDKLLGGPQAGIIAGSKYCIDRLKKNPLARVLRLDKMTLAALEATLRLYLNPSYAGEHIPTLRMLSERSESVRKRAEYLAKAIENVVSPQCARIGLVEETGCAGGGALPMCAIKTHAVRISFLKGNAQECETFLVQRRTIPIIGRIKKDCVVLDARTITEEDVTEIAAALKAYFADITDIPCI